MIIFRFSVANAEQIRFAFGGLASAVRDWRPHIWPAVRDHAVRPWLEEQFAKEGHGEHGAWPPLSEKYAAQKERKYPGKPILEASGRMKDELLSKDNKGEMTPQTFSYGSQEVGYSIWHQTGTKKMPARRIFDPEIEDERGTMKQMIRSAVAFGLTNHARALGFAVMGGEVSAADAARIGRGILARAGMQSFIGGRVPVSEGM